MEIHTSRASRQRLGRQRKERYDIVLLACDVVMWHRDVVIVIMVVVHYDGIHEMMHLCNRCLFLETDFPQYTHVTTDSRAHKVIASGRRIEP